MIKHTNPFYTINDAIDVLKNLSAKPLSNPFRYDESEIHWPDHVLSVHVSRVYNDKYEHYFESEIHLDKEGFVAFVSMTGLNVQREHLSDDYDTLYVLPGSLLKVFTLGAKEDTNT